MIKRPNFSQNKHFGKYWNRFSLDALLILCSCRWAASVLCGAKESIEPFPSLEQVFVTCWFLFLKDWVCRAFCGCLDCMIFLKISETESFLFTLPLWELISFSVGSVLKRSLFCCLQKWDYCRGLMTDSEVRSAVTAEFSLPILSELPFERQKYK